jgi:N-acetylmuramoyl-L-alanine amidase
MNLFRGTTTLIFFSLFMPVFLAAGSFSILDRPGKRVKELSLVPGERSSYLDLRELAAELGDSVYWETTGERLIWIVSGRSFVFEDRLSIFSLDGELYQFVAPSLLAGSRFLVPAQLAVEYLPQFFPERFVYNKLDGLLVDRTGVPVSRKKAVSETVEIRSVDTSRAAKSDGKNYRISTVVIDPGHGGRDPGALGRRHKLTEKHLVLEISQLVVAKLKGSGELKVILTRDRDVLVPLAERGSLANKNGAGLFVSIHCNASRGSDLRGASVYFLDAAKTDEERATAMLENASLQYDAEQIGPERQNEINLILQDMAQNEYLRESKDLCSFIQSEMGRLDELPEKGIRQANFAVLRGAFMPAALIETAYISNPNDESLLRNRKFRERLAEAIAGGILQYINQYHKKLDSGALKAEQK